jgi:transmembrane sensor
MKAYECTQIKTLKIHKQILKKLIEDVVSFLSKKKSNAGEKLFDRWYDSFDDTSTLMIPKEDEEAIKNRIKEKLFGRIRESYLTPATAHRPNIWIEYRIYQAVASVLLLVLAGIWWSSQPQPTQVAPITFIDRITPAGKRLLLVLPDSTRIWLNASSHIRFPEHFSEHKREVSLEGEAFFEVAHDTSKPFIVTTGALQTRVLGTSFNIKAYPDEKQIAVSVRTGKVGVKDSLSNVVLRPNQQVVYTPETGALVKKPETDINLITAWTEDKLIFKATPLAEIVQVLNRRHAVNIRFANEKLKNCRITTTFDKEPLERILQVICTQIGAQYQKKDTKIIITGDGCVR